MSEPNQPEQNYEIISPSLESTVRSLLPSVAGYGGLLRSTNTIIPVIDLSTAAEGSQLPESLQQAISFSDATSFNVRNANTTIISSPGFYRVFGVATNKSSSSSDESSFTMSDGATTKVVWSFEWAGVSGVSFFAAVPFDFIVFLAAGDSMNALSDTTNGNLAGSTRQIATVNGVLNNPTGFSFT